MRLTFDIIGTNGVSFTNFHQFVCLNGIFLQVIEQRSRLDAYATLPIFLK